MTAKAYILYVLLSISTMAVSLHLTAYTIEYKIFEPLLMYGLFMAGHYGYMHSTFKWHKKKKSAT